MFNRIGSKLGIKNRAQLAWCMYDWGNSGFATTIMAVILPIYFFDVAAKSLPENLRTAYWGYCSAVSLVSIAFLCPILGAIADAYGKKKLLTAVFTAIGVLGTSLLYFVGPGDWLLACFGYFLGNIGFTGGIVFYDSMLPHISSEQEADGLSLAGFALGYLGGGILLAINLLWIQQSESWGFADKGEAVRASFLSVAAWWAIFTLPLMIFVKEPPAEERERAPLPKVIHTAVQRLSQTWREIKSYRNLLIFLVAFYLYSDGIGTIIKMATTYGRGIGIEQGTLITAMLVVQLLGLPLTFAYGPLTRKFSAKPVLMGALAVYAFICVFGYFMTTATHFWILAILVACVQGGAQGLSRSIFSNLVPKHKSSEFFAFYSVSSKFAGIIGPTLFGLIAQFSGESRSSILILIVFFIVGGWLVSRVQLHPVRDL
jgi:UMF1 family MFS transporter